MRNYFKIKSAKVPLYRGYLVIIITNSVKKLKQYIPKFEDNGIYAHSYFHNFKNRQGFFVILNFNNELRKIHYGTITHESIHTAHFILQSRGLKESYENDEAETYLAEWITDKVYGFIKKNKFKVV